MDLYFFPHFWRQGLQNKSIIAPIPHSRAQPSKFFGVKSQFLLKTPSWSCQTIPHIFAVPAVPGEVSDLGISRFHFQPCWPWLDQLDFYSGNDWVSDTQIITKTGSVTLELSGKIVPFPLTLALILRPEAQPWVLWSVNSLHTQWVFYNSFMLCHTQQLNYCCFKIINSAGQLSYSCFKILNSAGLVALSSGNYWVFKKCGFVFPSRPFPHLLKSFELWLFKNLQNSSPEPPVLSVVCGNYWDLCHWFQWGQNGGTKNQIYSSPNIQLLKKLEKQRKKGQKLLEEPPA